MGRDLRRNSSPKIDIRPTHFGFLPMCWLIITPSRSKEARQRGRDLTGGAGDALKVRGLACGSAPFEELEPFEFTN